MYKIVGEVVDFDGQQPNRLPDNFYSPEFLLAMLRTPPAMPGAAHRLCSMLCPSERIAIESICRSAGGDLLSAWLVAAQDWSSVGSPSGRWEIDPLLVAYDQEVMTWKIDRIVVDIGNRRYVVLPDAAFDSRTSVLTFAEFKHIYGISVQAHLHQFVACEARRIDLALKDLDGRVVMRDIDLVHQTTGETRSHVLYVLDSADQTRWPLPAGWSLPQPKGILHV